LLAATSRRHWTFANGKIWISSRWQCGFVLRKRVIGKLGFSAVRA
jgi:hypothetical protein